MGGLRDVTTDTDSPPAFVDVLSHRRWALNPPEYDGPEAAAAQRRLHGDIRPLLLAAPRAAVHETARRLIDDRGWARVGDVLGADESRLEAVAVTPWLRFRDDVVIRLREIPDGTRVDMRSKSRLGGSDFGTNARRIRQFLGDLAQVFEPHSSPP